MRQLGRTLGLRSIGFAIALMVAAVLTLLIASQAAYADSPSESLDTSSLKAPNSIDNAGAEIGETSIWTVTFDSKGGSAVEPVKVESGKSIARPVDPTRDGYSFIEWQLDGKRYIFSTPVTANITLDATWVKDTVHVTMFRLYNPNSGEHFYTSDEKEQANLISLGWNDEDTGWIAPESSNTPVYRLYNSIGGEHHYTMDAAERDMLVEAGWNDEGIGWYSDDAKRQILYREYNPNAYANNHNYTTDWAEHKQLISIGWNDEGYAWYGLATS